MSNAVAKDKKSKKRTSKCPPSHADTMTESLFQCRFHGCGRTFKQKGNRNRHENTHSRKFEVSCEECGKTFLRKADLKVHMRMHTGEKPFTCSHPNCGRRFARKSDLITHERIHQGLKPYKCEHPGCDWRFARKFDLRKHMKTHDPSRKTKCRKNCSCTSSESDDGHVVTVPSLGQLICTEDHIHSPPHCFATMRLETELSSAPPLSLPCRQDTSTLTSEDTNTIVSEAFHRHPSMQSTLPFDPMMTPSKATSETHSKSKGMDLMEASESICTSSNCPSLDTKGLHKYDMHDRNPACGHLSIMHGDHRDYVVRDHLVCQDNSVKHIGKTSTEEKQCEKDVSHNPNCGHLAVRHNDHIDYVVEDSVFCRELGFLDGLDDVDLRRVEDEFWEFWDAANMFG